MGVENPDISGLVELQCVINCYLKQDLNMTPSVQGASTVFQLSALMLANITFHIVSFTKYSATARSESSESVAGSKFEVALVHYYLKVTNTPLQHQFTWYEIRHVG